MSTSCPKCYKAVVVEDVVIRTAHAVRKVQTCGRVLVEPKGRLIAQSIEAQQGVEVMGVLEGNVTSGGPVRIGPKAQWKGDCRAPTLVVELGAQIARGFFVVPYRPPEAPSGPPPGNGEPSPVPPPELDEA